MAKKRANEDRTGYQPKGPEVDPRALKAPQETLPAAPSCAACAFSRMDETGVRFCVKNPPQIHPRAGLQSDLPGVYPPCNRTPCGQFWRSLPGDHPVAGFHIR